MQVKTLKSYYTIKTKKVDNKKKTKKCVKSISIQLKKSVFFQSVV